MKQHSTVIITGSLGLLGSACVRLFVPNAETVLGIDNDSRAYFFGEEGSTVRKRGTSPPFGNAYRHTSIDIQNEEQVNHWFNKVPSITAVIHCAAQPAHDYSAQHPLEDFRVNALGTLHILEAARRYCPEAPFIFASTSKVYGDNVNNLPLCVSRDCKRFEVDKENEHARGITESLNISDCLHSPYGAGKASADLYVQEYARYYGMRTACFRPGTITGPDHAAVELHGFLAYLVKCCATGRRYTINGYGGYQVRDVIHADDLARAFSAVIDDPPKPGEPFITNFGGGLHSNCSMLEVIEMAEEVCKRKLDLTYNPAPRKGDHMWYVGSCEAFNRRYGPINRAFSEPGTYNLPFRESFQYKYTLPQIVAEIAERYKNDGKVVG